ncbi:MAG: LEA type 2 family protein [Treponema sp.]|jgi:LEA14-like dessication related protein|nr:LEA type 2 family protein [Treponema sp.]
MNKSLFFLLCPVLLCACATPKAAEAPQPVPVVSSPEPLKPAPEIRIQEPEFSISSIAIMQAELINTRFRARIRIDNPNNFPLELSAFSYELHGAGRYWAEGKETAPIEVPSEGCVEKDLFLTMNFINMKRETLDQVIALKTVRYRFSGDATVGAAGHPPLALSFDQSGESPVTQ